MKIITAGLPGTPFDIVARAIADKLSTSLKQTFIVETRPGAAGNVGAEFVAKAPADGYTLLMALDTTFTVNPSLYRKPPFDPLADFTLHFDRSERQQYAGRASVHSGQFGGRVRRLREAGAHCLRPRWQRQSWPSVHGIFPS